MKQADPISQIAWLLTPAGLLAAYAAAYAWLLQPQEMVRLNDSLAAERIHLPQYRDPSPAVALVFRPALWVDRAVRPDYWTWQEGPPPSWAAQVLDRMRQHAPPTAGDRPQRPPPIHLAAADVKRSW